MRSSLYECVVRHERYEPKPHRFLYRIFTFCLDLSEIDTLTSRIPFISRNRFNIFSFYDRDHADLNAVLLDRGVSRRPHRVELVTSLRFLGYVFNPVSFYFCYDEDNRPFAAVAEVNNTFGETKLYVLEAARTGDRTTFISRQPKEFYISPFVDLDVDLLIRLASPSARLALSVTDMRGDSALLKATMTGRRVPLTSIQLGWFAVKYPFLTLKVFAAIHWEAFRLWAKGIAFHRKGERPELQRGLEKRSVSARETTAAVVAVAGKGGS
jgi:uncharacterized protein